MSQFTVNLSTIFTEVPFLKRFEKAKKAGFSYVECQFPYPYSRESIKEKLDAHHLSMVLFNLPLGDWEKGDRGMAIDPYRIEEFRGSVDEGIRYATALQSSNIHCMAGVLSAELDRQKAREVYVQNIRYAASKMANYGLTLLIEPINSFDMPGYFLSDIHQAVHILEDVSLPNVKLQFDFYHIQRTQGNLLSTFQRYFDVIGHVQLADVPGRHQPGTGEINYQRVFEFLKALEYKGFIGLEYTPKEKSEESFDWLSTIGKGGSIS